MLLLMTVSLAAADKVEARIVIVRGHADTGTPHVIAARYGPGRSVDPCVPVHGAL
jgi:hypothetical protein